MHPRVSVVWQWFSSRLEYGPLVVMDDYSLIYCLAFLINGRIYTSSPAQLRILSMLKSRIFLVCDQCVYVLFYSTSYVVWS